MNIDNPARTAVEKLADKCKVLKVVHKEVKRITYVDVDVNDCPLKQRVVQKFRDLGHEDKLELTHRKKRPLIELIVSAPEI